MFWVFNTHLDHIGEQARIKGIELILSKIKTLNTKKYPVIFMGDFNTELHDKRIQDLKRKRTIAETFLKKNHLVPLEHLMGLNIMSPLQN